MTLVGLAARNVLRNPVRTGLTVLGVAIAVIAFVLLRTVIAMWNVAVDNAAADRIATRHKVSFIIPLPRRYVETVRTHHGVEAATWANWFGGKDPRNESDFFATIAVDPESFMDVYDELELPADQRAAWLENQRGAIVGQSLAARLGLEVGDRFTLKGTIYPGDWIFDVSGIYTASRRSLDQSQFLFHWDYLNETLQGGDRDKVGWIVARVSNSAGSAALSQEIDRAFEVMDEPTLTMSERAMNLSFMGMFSALLTAIDVVSVIILLILMMLLGNTIAMGVRERTQEYGVLRALGFLPKHVAMFILGEAATLGLLAGLVGLGIAYPLINFGVGRFIEENMSAYFMYFHIEPATAIGAMALAVGLGLASAAVPAIGASRLTVTGALRRID